MTPREIIAIREDIGLTRSEFSTLGGFGIASLQRWESGALIQNQANDRLIYLLQFLTNRKRIAKRDERSALESVDISASCAIGAPEGETRTFETLNNSSLYSLAEDETLMKAANIFTGLMNAGEMFQQV